MVHFTKNSPGFFFFTGKSFVKFFPIFKLESDFFPHFLSKIRKLENCENLFILNFQCAKFQGKKNLFGFFFIHHHEDRAGRSRQVQDPVQQAFFFLKLCTLKVQDKQIFEIFEFSDFAQKCGKKSDSSLKIGKNFTKDFPVKKNFHGNPL